METVKEKNTYGYSPDEYRIFNKNAWIVLLAFSILYCFLYCGRLNMGLAISSMAEQTDWTLAQLGILSSIFFWTYGFGHLFNGRLGEIFGVNKFIAIGVFLSGAANILISFQSSLAVICVLWGLNGYFQSMLWSPGMALLARWWPGHTRGFATGFANAFSGFGEVAAWLAVYLAFIILPGSGWRAAFSFPVVFMLIFVFVYMAVVKGSPDKVGLKDYEDPNKDMSEHEEEMKKVIAEKGKLYPYVFLFKQWRFVIWLFIIACSNIARYGLLTWIPTYFVQVYGTNPKEGIFGSLGLPLGMAFGTLIVPWLTDKYCPNNRMPAAIICSLIAAATVIGFSQVGLGTTAYVLLFIAGFFIYAINGIAWAYATDIGGRVFSGTAAGVLDWAAYMGSAVQALFFGFALGNGNWHLLFIAVAGASTMIAILSAIVSKGVKLKA